MSNLTTDFTVPGTSVSRQRGAMIVDGGLRMECGCWTKTASTTSICMPTDMNYVAGLICGSAVPTSIPCVSSGHIVATADVSVGVVVNYVAFGT